VKKNARYLVIIRIALLDYEYMQIGHIFYSTFSLHTMAFTRVYKHYLVL